MIQHRLELLRLDMKAFDRLPKGPSVDDFQSQPFTVVVLGLRITNEACADKKLQAEFQYLGKVVQVDRFKILQVLFPVEIVEYTF